MPVPGHVPPLHDRTHLPGEAAAAVSALELEGAAVTAQANELRRDAAMERKQSTDWERRATMAIGELRQELAQQATLRAVDHRRHAEEIEDELSEYEALESAYREAIDDLRRQALHG